MKKNKIQVAIFIIILILASIISINKILAAKDKEENLNQTETMDTFDWGYVVVREETNEDGSWYEKITQIAAQFDKKPDVEDLPIKHEDLVKKFYMFCIQKGINLPDYIIGEYDYSGAELYTRATKNATEEWVGEPIEGELSWAEAYILAFAKEKYTAVEDNEVQKALWEKLGYGADGGTLYDEAMAFQAYKNSNSDKNSTPSIDTSKQADYKFEYDGENNTLIAGPITINYKLEAEENGTKIKVGEIVENDCKVVITKNNGEEITISNFEFRDENGNSTGKKYPEPGKKTYLYIPYNEVGNLDVKSIKYEIGIKQMDIRAVVYKLNGVKAVYEWKGEIYGDPDTGTGVELQNLYYLDKVELFWRKFNLIIYFGPENPPPSPSVTPSASTTPKTPSPTPSTSASPKTPSPDTGTPPSESHKTYLDIGGKVWVDDANTKTNTLDGEYGTGEDYDRPNVKVTLYFDNGTKVQASDLAEGFQSNFQNPTWTDENGEYMFCKLPMDKKYYVEFTYDGMMYTTTEFLATDGSTSAYKNDPDKYEKSSMAKEDDTDRQTFNDRFTEIIGEGPNKLVGNYTTGKASNGGSTSSTLKYLSKKFNGNQAQQSRLLTTTNEEDVTKDHATGIARPATDSKEAGKYNGEDYEMTVSTRDSGIDNYPFKNKFTIWDTDEETDELEYLKHINLGLKRRTTSDLTLAVDIRAAGTAIKDKTKLVPFKSNVTEEDLVAKVTDEDVDGYIKDKKIKNCTSGTIVQDIAGTDYYWYINYSDIYGNQSTGFETDKDKLNVYVLYKIILGNDSESENTQATITGLIDYFSKELTIPNDDGDQEKIYEIFGAYGALNQANNYSWIDNGNKNYTYDITWSEPSETVGYNNIRYNTITTDKEIELGGSGGTKAIYLVLKVADGETKGLLSTNELKNITEITSYKIHDNSGKALGLVDKDSAPYNATPGNSDAYEDDTDDAPMFKLEINWNPKVIEGDVWDVADGTKVNDVKVELIEYVYKDGEIVGEVIRPGLTIEKGKSIGVEAIANERTDGNGHYRFEVEGGNYAVRFTYGDETMLETNKKYNAQDYQAAKPDIYKSLSEIYNVEHNMAKETTTDLIEYLKDRELLKTGELERNKRQQSWEDENWKTGISNNYSNARDLTSLRSKVIEKALVLTNDNATLLNTLNGDGGFGKGNVDKRLLDYTRMESVSDILIIESNDLVQESRIVNLGLEERPKVDIQLEKKVARIKLTANDGTVLIDTADNSKVSNVATDPETFYENALVYLDASVTDGATIDIDYTITVTNNAEEDDKLSNYIFKYHELRCSDYIVDEKEDFTELLNTLSKLFGETLSLDSPLPIRAQTINDYVNINLEYRAADNGGDGAIWTKVYDEDDKTTLYKNISVVNMPTKWTTGEDEEGPWLTENVIDQLDRSERKVVSKVLETNEKAETTMAETGNLTTLSREVSIALHLGISLAESSEGSPEDDFTYKNCAEIVQVYSGSGRRDYETIPGNYVPYDENEDTEEDSDITGTTTVIPPTGENRAVYVVIPIISIAIIIVGIILIKKKVLKK